MVKETRKKPGNCTSQTRKCATHSVWRGGGRQINIMQSHSWCGNADKHQLYRQRRSSKWPTQRKRKQSSVIISNLWILHTPECKLQTPAVVNSKLQERTSKHDIPSSDSTSVFAFAFYPQFFSPLKRAWEKALSGVLLLVYSHSSSRLTIQHYPSKT